MSRRWRLVVFLCFTAAAFACAFALPRIPQNPGYHEFADSRSEFGIPAFLNVASNVSFLLAGIGGLSLTAVRPRRRTFRNASERWPYAIFFAAIFLTCFGSGYYHLAPSNRTLVWDRIPMTIAFTSIFAGVISDRVGATAGRLCLLPMIAAGILSVVYWQYTELHSLGDLRPYAVVQFFTIAAIPLLMILFPSRYTHSGWLIACGGVYILAKIFEALDKPIFNMIGISGHTLKHIAASIAALCILEMLRRRRSVESLSCMEE